jgi:hypothetical protein
MDNFKRANDLTSLALVMESGTELQWAIPGIEWGLGFGGMCEC